MIPNCFKISNFSKLNTNNSIYFQIFSFFKIISVQIDEEKKKAEIIFDSIGRTEKIENKIK